MAKVVQAHRSVMKSIAYAKCKVRTRSPRVGRVPLLFKLRVSKTLLRIVHLIGIERIGNRRRMRQFQFPVLNL